MFCKLSKKIPLLWDFSPYYERDLIEHLGQWHS